MGVPPIPVIAVNDTFTYLGRNFDSLGMERLNIDGIKKILRNLLRAPLKPQQKLLLLFKYLIPRFTHDLQYFAITAHTLNNCNIAIRAATKHILHLPAHISTAYLHAKVKDGGLGVSDLTKTIPMILAKRLNNLGNSGDTFSSAALLSMQGEYVTKRIKRLTNRLETCNMITSHFRKELEESYSGHGLHQGSINDISGHWVYSPPPFWSGRDYVKAIQLRGNVLPTMGLPYNPPEAKKCRGGCPCVESLSHVLQSCKVSHWARIERLDHVVKSIKQRATKSGYAVDWERYVRQVDGINRKPDLICVKDDQVVLCDVAVSWESRSLSIPYGEKMRYYGKPEFIAALRRLYGDNKTITIAPLILGARGIWCRENRTVCNLLGLTKFDCRVTSSQVYYAEGHEYTPISTEPPGLVNIAAEDLKIAPYIDINPRPPVNKCSDDTNIESQSCAHRSVIS